MNARAWEFVRAIRGPVMLMTFGTLMTLSHTDTLEFDRSFPILVIVYGVFKLVERLLAPPLPPGAPPSWHQPQTAYPGEPYPPPAQYPPVYPPPQQGGNQ